jgi:hypothetical protein
MQVNRYDIPGFPEAVERQNDDRDAAFLELTTSICGIEIRQMTPEDFLILNGINSPLLRGGIPSPAHVAKFLWHLSPDYNPQSESAFSAFMHKVGKINYADAIKSIKAYLERTFMDSPGESDGESVSYASWCAHIVDVFASEYGWPRKEVLKCSFRVLYQQMNCIKKRHNPDAPVWNPSDKLIREHRALKQQRFNLLKLLSKRASAN